MVKGMVTCKVCGRDFPLIAENRYTARDSGKTGALVGLTVQDEERNYDAFDCPHCGCQNVMQERKKECNPTLDCQVGDDEHDGCAGCRYEDCTSEDYPCSECCENCDDHYEIGEGTTDGE